MQLVRAIGVSMAVGMIGCGGSPTRAREALEAAPAFRCVVSGDAHALWLTVEGLPDHLRVEGLRVDVTVLGEHATARVLRPLAFEGTTDTRGLRAVVREPVRVGAIGLAVGAPFVELAASADAALEGTAVLDGGDNPSDSEWIGVAVRTAVPCGALRLGSPEAPAEPAASASERDAIVVGAQDLTLRDAPGGSITGTVRISMPEGAAARVVQVLERIEGWAQVRRVYAFGSIEGWVEAARLGEAPREPALVSASGHGSGSECGRTDHPYSYRGPGAVRAGARVIAEETGRAWAVVAEDVAAELGVRPSGAVEVIAIDGLHSQQCDNLEFDLAVVEGTDVRIEAE